MMWHLTPGMISGRGAIDAAVGGGGSDPNWSSVKLLLGFEGSDASTGTPGMDDESSAAHGTGTVAGNAQIDTAQFKFGSSSLLLDGTGDSVTFADSADWLFAGEFTMEGFIRVPAGLANGTYSILSIYQGAGTRSFRLYMTEGTSTRVINFTFSTDGSTGVWGLASTDVSSPFTDETWVHVAVDRDASNKARLYVEGTMVASQTGATGTNFDSASVLNIGGAASGQINFNGWIDELRITSGVARYASDGGYTVPTAAFPRS